MKRPIAIAPADLVEATIEDLPFDTLLVVCDPDGGRAAATAARVTNLRTAVFVGALSTEEDRANVEAYSVDVLGGEAGRITFLG